MLFRSIMPGVLIVEALAQTAAVAVAKAKEPNLENLSVFFMTIDKCKFRKPVTPGDVLDLYVKRTNKVKNVYKFEGKCLVDGVIFAQCNFTAMIQDDSITSSPRHCCTFGVIAATSCRTSGESPME